MASVAAALEPWRAVAPRRRRATERRPRRCGVRRPARAARGSGCGPSCGGRLRARPVPGAAAGPTLRVLPRRLGSLPSRAAASVTWLRNMAEDLRVSDFCSSALETITQCLGEQLEQLQAPVETPAEVLAEALGSLHLGSAPGESGEPLVPGTCLVKCVCYGLGNFASCATARIQLAFLLLLLEKCHIPRSHCCVYDPLFSHVETTVLMALGVMVLKENEEGKHSVGIQPTVFYMPHCGMALYNNLLWSNWSTAALSRTVIIGNSFRSLEERLLTRILQKSYPYIAKILKGLKELALPQTPQYMDTFNDMSVHWFPVSKLERLSNDLWASREEPDYQDCEDLEIIRKPADSPLSHLTGAAGAGAAIDCCFVTEHQNQSRSTAGAILF
ncbi:SRR1-like protein [Nannospalax galili]|uniref:SRR1-like protein n=1 Tax=Nannospalax galili TaxID=1026970 RepID=UPI00111BE9BB|nr:SRR1-like protein [Nannospalax galili]